MVERDTDSVLKTFNTAKKFAEDIIFPLMFDFKKFQRQANFGADKLEDALIMSEEVRTINRFNGLKGMADTAYDLLQAISSTIKLKGNKEENIQLQLLLSTLEKTKLLFYEHKERFFNSEYKGMKLVETLDRNYFDKIMKIINVCYINTEILMTKNKILFSDASDEFRSDAEIMDEIKKEYSGE